MRENLDKLHFIKNIVECNSSINHQKETQMVEISVIFTLSALSVGIKCNNYTSKVVEFYI